MCKTVTWIVIIIKWNWKKKKKKKKKKILNNLSPRGFDFWLTKDVNDETFATRQGFHDSVFRTLIWLANIRNAWNVSETMIWLAKPQTIV